MVVLRRQRPNSDRSLEAATDDVGLAESFEANDLPSYDERWELLLDNLEELLILAAWMFLLLAGGLLIFR